LIATLSNLIKFISKDINGKLLPIFLSTNLSITHLLAVIQ